MSDYRADDRAGYQRYDTDVFGFQSPTPPRDRRPGRWPFRLLSTLVVLLLLAAAVGGWALYRQHRTLSAARAYQRSLGSQLKAAQTRQQAAGTAARLMQKSLSDLTSSLDATKQQLARDEATLKLAQQQLPPDTVALAQRVAPSVVVLHCDGSLIGSGFALALPARPGYSSVIVTAAHVVDACRDQDAELTISQNGSEQPMTLRGEGKPSQDGTPGDETDIALLDTQIAVPPLEPATTVSVGEFAMVIGNPLIEQFSGTVTTGAVSNVATNYLLHTASTSHGNSGGPVVDRSGKVLGVVSSGYADEENLNVAMRLNNLCLAGVLTGSCPFG